MVFESIDEKAIDNFLSFSLFSVPHTPMGVDPALVSSQYVNEEDNERYTALKALGRDEKEGEKVAFFDDLWIAVMSLVRIADVNTFEDARKVFLRAAARIDSAKKYYVLDGKSISPRCLNSLITSGRIRH